METLILGALGFLSRASSEGLLLGAMTWYLAGLVWNLLVSICNPPKGADIEAG